jgi:hypothetical protein
LRNNVILRCEGEARASKDDTNSTKSSFEGLALLGHLRMTAEIRSDI